MRVFLTLLAAASACAQSFAPQTSGTQSALRGVWAVNEQIVWASGAHGTYLRTTDGGAHWTAATVPGAESLDFRDVQGVDANTARPWRREPRFPRRAGSRRQHRIPAQHRQGSQLARL